MTNSCDHSPTRITGSNRGGGGTTTAMRVIVPLQGVVQGRGGLFLGSVIPCPLFYFWKLYVKCNRPSSSTNSGDNNDESNASEMTHLLEVSSGSGLHRVYSRILLSSKGSTRQCQVSARANAIISKQIDGKSPNNPILEQSYATSVTALFSSNGTNLQIDYERKWQ
ncbi:putative LRR receptor-like serine/threonine-protein kinase-like [Capsicum annuum]|nr:putative LRR receptor-like serine/threonine-protein kinase-like [Capsicum annuum]